MANVNIQTSPAKLSAVHYPVAFLFESDIIGAAAKASGGITITTASSGDYIKFDDGDIYIYCSDDPKFGQYFSTAAASLSDVAISLGYAINENPALNYKYLATPIPAFGVVSIESIKNGSRFNQTITVPPGIATTNLTGGADENRGQSLDNYVVWCELRLASGTYNGSTSATDQVGIFSSKFNENNEYYFDFFDILKNYVGTDTPTLGGSAFLNAPNSVTPYTLVYGEGYSSGSTYVRKYFINSVTNKWVINSSLPLDGDGDMSQYYQATGATFLTSIPSTKRTRMGSHEPLSIFWQYANAGLSFRAIIDFTFKGSASPVSILRNTTSPSVDGMYYLDCGTAALNVANINTSNNDLVDTYTVTYYARNGFTLTQISQPQTYQIDYDCSDEEVELIWTNSLGGYDSWTFSGKKATSSKSDKRIAQQYLKNTNGVYVNKNIVLGNEETEEITVNSGWLYEEEFNFIKGIDNSPSVWLYDGSNPSSIIVINSKIDFNSDTKLYSISVTYQKSIKKNHITN